MSRAILFFKAHVSGYTRRNGTYVAPHTRKDGAHAVPGQLVLYPARGAAKPVHPTETPAFRRWFGDSKAVDASGRPKVFYHGSGVWERGGKQLGDIREFNRRASVDIVGRGESMDTVGSWFSDQAGSDGAEMYSGSQGVMYPVYLSIKNPWRPRSFDEFLDKMHETAGRDPKKQNPKGRGTTDDLRAWLKQQGYDGIVFGPYGNGSEFGKQQAWVALEPTQIKSAIANNGEFDPESSDITKSLYQARSAGAE